MPALHLPLFVTVAELARVLCLPKATAYRLARRIGVTKVGLNGLRIPVSRIRSELGDEAADAFETVAPAQEVSKTTSVLTSSHEEDVALAEDELYGRRYGSSGRAEVNETPETATTFPSVSERRSR